MVSVVQPAAVASLDGIVEKVAAAKRAVRDLLRRVDSGAEPGQMIDELHRLGESVIADLADELARLPTGTTAVVAGDLVVEFDDALSLYAAYGSIERRIDVVRLLLARIDASEPPESPEGWELADALTQAYR